MTKRKEKPTDPVTGLVLPPLSRPPPPLHLRLLVHYLNSLLAIDRVLITNLFEIRLPCGPATLPMLAHPHVIPANVGGTTALGALGIIGGFALKLSTETGESTNWRLNAEYDELGLITQFVEVYLDAA